LPLLLVPPLKFSLSRNDEKVNRLLKIMSMFKPKIFLSESFLKWSRNLVIIKVLRGLLRSSFQRLKLPLIYPTVFNLLKQSRPVKMHNLNLEPPKFNRCYSSHFMYQVNSKCPWYLKWEEKNIKTQPKTKGILRDEDPLFYWLQTWCCLCLKWIIW
jgi:hypothetical protein